MQICFSHSDILCIFDIQEDLYKLRQGALDVSNYFTQLKVLWEKLESYRPLLACSCAIPCSCRAIYYVQKYHEQGYVIHFLKGLNEHFTHSKFQIMMMSPLPDIDKAFSLVIQQEREMNNSVVVVNPSTEDTVAFQVQTQSGN